MGHPTPYPRTTLAHLVPDNNWALQHETAARGRLSSEFLRSVLFADRLELPTIVY
jgi:hypothetical protein